MLNFKLKNASKKEVIISFRKKHPLLSQDLSKGLLIAIGFHMLLFATFRVVTAQNLSETSLLLPVSVEVDLGRSAVSLGRPSKIGMAPLDLPPAPLLPDLPPCPIVPYDGDISLNEADFLPLEKLPYVPLTEEES